MRVLAGECGLGQCATTFEAPICSSSPHPTPSNPTLQNPLPWQTLPMIIKVLSKSMDTPLGVDKIELATLTRDAATGKVSGGGGPACMH